MSNLQPHVTFDQPPPSRIDVHVHELLTSPSPKARSLPPRPAKGNDMKQFLRGKVEPWNCRVGQNSIIIRMDGSLAPYFPMYSATYDWGVIEDHKFEVAQLNEMKKTCQTHSFSTLNHNLGFCYNDTPVIKWVLTQAKHGFQGVTGSFA